MKIVPLTKKQNLNSHRGKIIKYLNLRTIPVTFNYSNVTLTSMDEIAEMMISYSPSDYNDANDLSDLMAFLKYSPTYIQTDDLKFNEKLSELYETITDFHTEKYEIKGVQLKKATDDIYYVKLLNLPVLFSLYNTALKQPEPLAHCIFLFRMIEHTYLYSNKDNVKPKFNNRKPDYITYIENLYNSSINHKFLPVLYQSYGVNKSLMNIVSKWKREGKKIVKNLNQRLGSYIYSYGRCGIAHGSNNIIFHDYSKHYHNINNINLILNLISRYLIERENPDLYNFINKKFTRKGIFL